VLVGAPGAGNGGAAFLFETATAPATLLNTFHSQAEGRFGYSVAFSGANVLVGAPATANGATPQAGRVYLFDGSTYGVLKLIENPTPAAAEAFGATLATTAITIAIGAPRDEAGADQAGAVYLYDAAGNALVASDGTSPVRLQKPLPDVRDHFGGIDP